MGVALGIEIDGTDGAAVFVGLNATDVTVGADLQRPVFSAIGITLGERSGLCADFASESEAEAQFMQAGAAGARLGQIAIGAGYA